MLNVDSLAPAERSADITSECLEIVLKEAKINKQRKKHWAHASGFRTHASCLIWLMKITNHASRYHPELTSATLKIMASPDNQPGGAAAVRL